MTRRGNTLLRTVDELMIPGTASWDEALIRSIFLPLDAERIINIPLSENATGDFVAWNRTKSFSFIVRSAYYVEWEHQFGSRCLSIQSTSNINPVWETVWKLEIPTKVKIFIWRAVHGLIPGMVVLARRHIKVSPLCPVCRSGLEDIKHLIFSCPRAVLVWRALGLDVIIKQALSVDRSGSVVLEESLR